MSDLSGIEALEAELQRMSDRKLVKTVQVLEQAGSHQAVQKALDAARPRLVRLRPTRRLSLMRLFCIPFEDFLANTGVVKTEYQRVSRAALPGLWRTFEAVVSPEQLTNVAKRLRAVDPEDRGAAFELGVLVWQMGAEVMAKAAAEQHPTLRHTDNMTVDQSFMVSQAALVAEILEVADPIQRMKAALPGKPIEVLTPDDLKAVDELLVGVAKAKSERVGHFLLALGHRMKLPGDLLPLISDFSFWSFLGTRERVTSAMAGFVLDRVETELPRLSLAVDTGSLNKSTMASQLRSLIHDVTETRRTMRPKGGDPLYLPLQKTQANLRKMVRTQILEPSENTLLADLDRNRADRDLDPKAVKQSEETGRAIRKLKDSAEMVGLAEEFQARIAEYEESITGFAEQALANMRPGNPALEKVQENFFVAVRLLESVSTGSKVQDLMETGLLTIAELDED